MGSTDFVLLNMTSQNIFTFVARVTVDKEPTIRGPSASLRDGKDYIFKYSILAEANRTEGDVIVTCSRRIWTGGPQKKHDPEVLKEAARERACAEIVEHIKTKRPLDAVTLSEDQYKQFETWRHDPKYGSSFEIGAT